jgi:drug/metabolite transporter (DMT)-like permease
VWSVKDAEYLRGYVLAFIGTAFWSTSAVFISYLTTRFRMPPLVLAFWRDVLVACSLAVALALVGRGQLHLERRHVPFFVFYGLFLAVFNSVWVFSVALNGAALATVLLYVSPAFTALIEWRWGNERLNELKIIAIALSVVGCVFASGAYDRSFWKLNLGGIVVGLATGFAFTFYSLLGRVSSRKGVRPWTTTLYTFAFGSAFLLLVQRPGTFLWLSRPLASGAGDWREVVLGWGTMLVLAIGPTLGGYGLYVGSLTYLPATTANLIVTLEPAMTAVLAFLFLGERLAVPQLVGSGVILGGVFLLRISDRRALIPDLLEG